MPAAKQEYVSSGRVYYFTHLLRGTGSGEKMSDECNCGVTT